MVNKKVLISFLILVTLSQSGCSLIKNMWNEKAPSRKKVMVDSQAMPPFLNIVDGDDAQSEATLKKWKESALSSFNQIEGKTKDFLSEDEITVLIQNKLISLADDEALSIERAHSLIRLLGFKGGISRNNVDELFTWAESNRERIRTFYQLFLSENLLYSIDSKNTIQLIELAGSLFALGGEETVKQDEMAILIRPWVPTTQPYLKKSLKSGVNIIVSFFGSFCGDRVEQDGWNGKKIGSCLYDLVKHFKPLAAEVDFLVGALNPITERAALAKSNDQLVPLVKSWMEEHAHPAFPLSRISDLSNDLEIPKPYNFFKLTEWLPKLNQKNTTDLFHPDFMIDIAGVIQNWVGTLLVVTEKQVMCDKKVWTQCAYTGKYETLDKLYNDEYATLVRSKDLHMVSRLSLFEAVVKLTFDALDTKKTGYLGVEIKELITVTIRAIDSTTFFANVIRRLQERPVFPSSLEETLKKIEKTGLSEVAAMAAEILPNRGLDKRRNFWQRFKSNFTRKDKRIPYTIDALGLTSLLYIFDLITDLRLDYVERYKFDVVVETPVDSYIKRAEIVKKIPQMLFDHFPRTYNACLEWGFERTCGTVFTQVFPNPLPGRDDTQPYEMDMMTLTAIFAESIMSRCDRDHDDFVRRTIFDGNDEKMCVLKITQAIVTRLMNAGIMDEDPKTRKLLNLVTGNRLFQYIGKAALGRGTLDKIPLYALPPMAFMALPASLGSILSLTAELMNGDRVDAIKEGKMGPSAGAGPGDELVYMNQLTDHYLPVGKAKRTSSAALARESYLFGGLGIRHNQ